MNNKKDFKNYSMFFGIFVAGMLSVSIANFFGGYYCSVTAVVAILTTLYMLSIIDGNEFKENKLNVIFISILVALELAFFVANDIVGYPIYKSSNLDAFGIIVISSQIYSMAVIAYRLITIVWRTFQKESVELVDDAPKKKTEVHVEKTVENHVEETTIDEQKEQEIRRIAHANIKKEAPFMEEEI